MSERVSLGGPPAQNPSNQPAPGEPGFVVPTEAVPLPSKGLVYPVDSALHGMPTVEIRSMTARDEDILTSRALLKQGKAISTLLRSCLTNKSVDVDSMLVGDRNAILIAIRVTGYGADYATQVECPHCEEKTKHEFNLSQLAIKPLGASPVAEGLNVFTFTLPVMRKEVTFKLMTGADERDLSVTLDRSRKAAGVGGIENGVTTRLIYQVLSIGDEKDPNKLATLIRNLPARDSRELRTHIDNISPGVDMRQEFTCPGCGAESEVEVPMGTEFFWPKA